LRHLLPNVVAPVLVASTLAVGDVILIEAGLSFLGVGIRPPTPSWGAMILDAKSTLFSAPWTGAFPGLAIMITVIAVNWLGEALRDTLDPRRG
jgi:ABC-type dipeptide/oligopeptide/nickel transport system permease subunit